ncbi:alpha/beta hydrolase [Paenibacillus sp. sptzw28]|uniref:alpha/beta fold hydrolase n=1 Tax=Paenibacillus sp. sptzw28 TaxID=715179 RepID=UPI001C6ED116|nr:alpha/beta hydrolase [Paenibacillus sp. sptzw28]QYR23499.1 alpha/beta hydrolase [Paenibacillus sp. sptzw28]
MAFLSGAANNNGININYYDSVGSGQSLAPVLICPGLSETAEEYLDLLEYLLPRRGVVLSFRGRGKSDTPLEGYDLQDHITDIGRVIQHAGLTKYHLLGNSRGASYALKFAQEREQANHVLSLTLIDYPPEHRQMPPGWAEDYINNYLIPFDRLGNIRAEAVWGIQRDSAQIALDHKMKLPALVIRGLLEGSLISDHDLNKYKEIFRNLTVHEFANSGHNIRTSEKEQLEKSIADFLSSSEKGG